MNKTTTLRIIIDQENIKSTGVKWKLLKIDNKTLHQHVISSGSEHNLEDAFKEAKHAYYNTN